MFNKVKHVFFVGLQFVYLVGLNLKIIHKLCIWCKEYNVKVWKHNALANTLGVQRK